MRDRRIATWVVVLLWVPPGPVGMALSGCIMMDGCDALCGMSSPAPALGTDQGAPLAAAGLDPAGPAFVPQNVWTVLDSPPKPAPVLL
jgi:hypothetical protein